MIRLAAILILPLSAAAAPVPAHLMPKSELQLRYNPASNPLGSTFEVILRNPGGSDLQVWTDRPFGIATFFDCEVLNAKGERVSRPYQWRTPADEHAIVRLVQTVPARKSYVTTLPVFQAVDEKKLVPGSYKVRVRFHYQDYDAVSDWITVEILESQIRTKAFVFGP